MRKLLQDRLLFKLLEMVDLDLLEKAREGRCVHCGARLHRADYKRQAPKGLSDWNKRWSLCCERDGCRKRKTPPSVRFLGRRVYPGFVVVLVSAMMHGLNPARVERVRQVLGIDEHTMKRWRQWWLEEFVQSPFWKAARARLMPPVEEGRLPLSLVEAFGAHRREGLVRLMKFLGPLTTSSCREVGAM
jgi:hypothetical protein